MPGWQVRRVDLLQDLGVDRVRDKQTIRWTVTWVQL